MALLFVVFAMHKKRQCAWWQTVFVVNAIQHRWHATGVVGVYSTKRVNSLAGTRGVMKVLTTSVVSS